MSLWLIPILLFGGLGLWLAGAGIQEWLEAREFVAGAIARPGKVVDYVEAVGTTADTDGDAVEYTAYIPVIEYADANGALQRVRVKSSSSAKTFAIGAAVTLLCSREDPALAEIRSFGQLWLRPVGFTIVGTVQLCIALGIAVWAFDIPLDRLWSRPR